MTNLLENKGKRGEKEQKNRSFQLERPILHTAYLVISSSKLKRKESSMYQRVAAEDGTGAVQRDGRAVELGDAPAGFLQDERARSVVPRL